ncbi:DUF1491 family protein [Stakelama sp. CBK3Z-3]|uniref:DUF1491 family protein n=1 Tax=Stakelama flava TaxID=2860338 RepID=A0ABS6XLQ4_9SPHN|nr:DUF1491 family protein [Stakelama flava]MBW4330733.1 DUF1491 family protein [Stakelama flava]
MAQRPTTDFLVGALLRRVQGEGGSAMVLARGEPMSGSILVLTLERGGNPRFFERMPTLDGGSALVATGPKNVQDEVEAAAYWQRRRERDRDLWVIELDIAEAERLAASVLIHG